MNSVQPKSSLLYIGWRNTAVLDACAGLRTEIEINVVGDISGLKDFLGKKTPDVIIIELIRAVDDVSSLMAYIQRLCGAPIIVINPIEEIKTAVNALRNGAYNYVPEPFSPADLTDAVFDALRMRILWRQVHESQNIKMTSIGGLIGSAPCMQALFRTILSVGNSDATVFIQGPSGTGKELVARAIHDNSMRLHKSFVPINCGAIPANLIESELFGHERGAFTGAAVRKTGKFELAEKGAIFLDEITEMPLDLQVKLLRVIQERQFSRVGGSEIIDADVRIICATNKDPIEEVKRGKFREDLYYRLNVVPVKTPALSERRGDIPLLLAHFLDVFTEKYNKYFYEFSPGAMGRLQSYSWPGNVREMENLIERIVVLYDGTVVEEKFLPDEILNAPVLPAEFIPSEKAPPWINPDHNHRAAAAPVTMTLGQMELEAIKRALLEAGGNVVRASKILGVGQATLYRKIKKHGLEH
jgi:DNA-binding NtrC family response regulator